MPFKPSSLCVFCGSRTGNEAAYLKDAKALAQRMAEQDIELIYGAGSIGLMGVIADEVLAHGGKVTGVIPQFLETYEVGHKGLSRMIITDSMHARKKTMFDLSDGFVSLPGGLGTLDETFEILTWKQLRLHDKPIVILDTQGYWEPLEALIQQTIRHDFAHEKVSDLYRIATTVPEVFDKLGEMPPVHKDILDSHL